MLRQELPWREPAEAARCLYRQPGFVWLDSADAHIGGGRYSYMASNPISRFRWGAEGVAEDFATKFRAWQKQYQSNMLVDGAPFQGGAIGYVSYEAADIWMSEFRSRHRVSCIDALEFGLYDTVLAFDHHAQSLTVYSARLAGPDCAADERLAEQRINDLKQVLSEGREPLGQHSDAGGLWSLAPAQAPYVDRVAATREAILDGEIYQANIAGLWDRSPYSYEDAFFSYLALRERTQAAFSAFGAFTHRGISCLSPERLVAMTSQGAVRAEPIKGTVARSSDPQEDLRLSEALAASEKDRAENIMIVDLLRNDLSKVCQPESVVVSRLCDVESLPNLFHLVSTIEGRLVPGHDAVDLLEAVFPGGSVTGAPKLRAMEVIDDLEPAARGAFLRIHRLYRI